MEVRFCHIYDCLKMQYFCVKKMEFLINNTETYILLETTSLRGKNSKESSRCYTRLQWSFCEGVFKFVVRNYLKHLRAFHHGQVLSKDVKSYRVSNFSLFRLSFLDLLENSDNVLILHFFNIFPWKFLSKLSFAQHFTSALEQ